MLLLVKWYGCTRGLSCSWDPALGMAVAYNWSTLANLGDLTSKMPLKELLAHAQTVFQGPMAMALQIIKHKITHARYCTNGLCIPNSCSSKLWMLQNRLPRCSSAKLPFFSTSVDYEPLLAATELFKWVFLSAALLSRGSLTFSVHVQGNCTTISVCNLFFSLSLPFFRLIKKSISSSVGLCLTWVWEHFFQRKRELSPQIDFAAFVFAHFHLITFSALCLAFSDQFTASERSWMEDRAWQCCSAGQGPPGPWGGYGP